MSDWYITESRPKQGKIPLDAAKARMARYMTHLGVQYHHDWVIWQPVRCPFHDDRHASASLNLHSNRFNCHACGVHGDALDLVMEEESLTLGEAAKWLMAL
jgi:CHC2 zinc finger